MCYVKHFLHVEQLSTISGWEKQHAGKNKRSFSPHIAVSSLLRLSFMVKQTFPTAAGRKISEFREPRPDSKKL